MRIGCCGSPEEVALYAEIGFDYIEPSVQLLLDDACYARLEHNIIRYKLKAEAFNCLLPASLPAVGPDVRPEALREYLRKVFPRVQSLGGEIVVFGSGQARNIPQGFSEKTASDQLFAFLELAAEVAGDRIKVVIEPLCRQQTNLLNQVSQARKVCEKLNWRVGLLADLHHMTQEAEPLSNLLPVSQLSHIHIPFPEEKYPIAAFLREFKSNGHLRVSLEDNGMLLARTPEADKRHVLKAALDTIRELS